MPTDCNKCKNDSAGPRDIEFFYKGFKFSVFKTGRRCPDCVAEEYKELFDDVGGGLIHGAPEHLEIDWGVYCNTRNGETKNRIAQLLRALGIFSVSSKDNWCIVVDGEINLDPTTPFMRVFFTRVQDAVDYACEEYANTLYGWEIWKIGEVLPMIVVTDKAL